MREIIGVIPPSNPEAGYYLNLFGAGMLAAMISATVIDLCAYFINKIWEGRLTDPKDAAYKARYTIAAGVILGGAIDLITKPTPDIVPSTLGFLIILVIPSLFDLFKPS